MSFGPQVDSSPATSDLKQSLEALLVTGPGVPCRIMSLHRRPSAYSSSYPLEELTIYFRDGRQLELIFKDLSPNRADSPASQAKPHFLIDPQREIACYRELLSGLGLATPTYYGSVVESAEGRYWLFLEKVKGRELYQIGEFAVWKDAARWLATFHSHPAHCPRIDSVISLQPIRYDAGYYSRWLQRAMTFRRPAGEHIRQIEFLSRLAKCYPQVIAEILKLPLSILHGEFYSSNIIVRDVRGGGRICPLDWECAGLGPGLIDLAALTAGRWTESERTELAQEYFCALQVMDRYPANWDSFLRGLQLCRLHLAVQWLGWSEDWLPPPEHRYDWLSEAIRTTDALGLPM